MLQVKATLTGLEPALGKLKTIKAAMQKRILAGVLGKAGRKVKAALAQAAPQSSDATAPQLIHGLLRLSFDAKTKAYRNSGVVVVIVGPRTNFDRDKKTRKRQLSAFGKRVARKAARLGKSAKQAPAFYAHLAGPGRKERFMAQAQRTLDSLKGEIEGGIMAGVEAASK